MWTEWSAALQSADWQHKLPPSSKCSSESFELPLPVLRIGAMHSNEAGKRINSYRNSGFVFFAELHAEADMHVLRKESRFNRMKRPGSANVRAQANRRLLPQPPDQRIHQLSARPRYLLSNFEVCSHSFDLIQCIRTCLIDSFLYSYLQEESI
jgi:hypothetical protein